MGIDAMTAAFEPEAKRNAGGKWTQEKHDILVAGYQTLLVNIEALQCRRQEELDKLETNVAVGSMLTQLAL